MEIPKLVVIEYPPGAEQFWLVEEGVEPKGAVERLWFAVGGPWRWKAEDAAHRRALAEEACRRFNGYLDLVAKIDHILCVWEDTGAMDHTAAAALRKVLEAQGWDKDALSNLLDAREAVVEMTPAFKEQVAVAHGQLAREAGEVATDEPIPQDTALRMMQIELANKARREVATASPERYFQGHDPVEKPYTVVLLYPDYFPNEGGVPSVAMQVTASKPEIASILAKGRLMSDLDARFGEPDVINDADDLLCLAIYEGHHTNLVN